MKFFADNARLYDVGGMSGGAIVLDGWNGDRLDFELKDFFGWRTPTKGYSTFRDRFNRCGSSMHDAFLQHVLSRYPSSVSLG